MEKQSIETYCKHPENHILIITSSVNVPFYVPTETVDSSHTASTGCKSIRICSVRSANPSNDPHMCRRMWIYIIPVFICCFWHDYTLKMRVTRKCDSVHVIFSLSRFYLAFVFCDCCLSVKRASAHVQYVKYKLAFTLHLHSKGIFSCWFGQ